MKTLVLVIACIAASFAFAGCTKTYPTTVVNNYISDTANTVIVHYTNPNAYALTIYANGQIILMTQTAPSDSFRCPDSAYLYARAGSFHDDTTASPGMTWNIGQ